MKKWLWTGLVLAIGSVTVYGALRLAFPEPGKWAKIQGVASSLAKSRGCRDSLTGLARETPGWVSVDPADPQVVVEGIVHRSKVADVDFPFSHDSHDFNWDVLLDPPYWNRVSDANTVRSGVPVMEMEWESRYFPTTYWPVAGDRVFVRGRWIFDCGHPPYYTELHPVSLSVATRYKPYHFPDQVSPSHANMTYIFAGGQGGYYTTQALGRDVTFNVPIPPKPSPNATLVTQVVSTSHSGAAPILTNTTVNGTPMVNVVLPLSRIPDSTPRWWLHDWILEVQRALIAQKQPPPMNRPKNPPTYSAILASAWKEPTVSKGFRMLRVTFEDYVVHDDHDVGSGEWNMVIRCNDQFMMLPQKSVDDGDRVTIGQSFTVVVPEDGHVRVGAHGWEDDYDSYFGVGMPPSVFDAGSLNGNESLGMIDVAFAKNQDFGAGKRWPLHVAKNDYGLNIRIDEVRRFPAGSSNAREYYAAEIKSVSIVDSESKTPTIPLAMKVGLNDMTVSKNVQAKVGGTTPLAGVRAVVPVDPGSSSFIFSFESALPSYLKNRGSKLPPELVSRPIKIRKTLPAGTHTERFMHGATNYMEIQFTIAKSNPPLNVRGDLINRLGGNVLKPATGAKPPPATRKPPIGGIRPGGTVKPPATTGPGG